MLKWIVDNNAVFVTMFNDLTLFLSGQWETILTRICTVQVAIFGFYYKLKKFLMYWSIRPSVKIFVWPHPFPMILLSVYRAAWPPPCLYETMIITDYHSLCSFEEALIILIICRLNCLDWAHLKMCECADVNLQHIP